MLSTKPHILLKESFKQHFTQIVLSLDIFFFTKWVAVRATAMKLWEIADTSTNIVFFDVPASGAFTNE